jgi:hypothetical protein
MPRGSTASAIIAILRSQLSSPSAVSPPLPLLAFRLTVAAVAGLWGRGGLRVVIGDTCGLR